MRLTIALDQRFYRTPDGRYWTEALYPHSFWSRYLTVFDNLKILARVREAPAALETWKRVDGDRVSVTAVPAYVGPWDFIRKWRKLRSLVALAMADDSAILLSVPGAIATMACSLLPKGRPFALEVIGDPYDSFSPGANSHPLRRFFRWWMPRVLRAQCRKATCTLYVTQQALQRRYPPAAQELEQTRQNLSFAVSDVDLPHEAFISDEAVSQSIQFRPTAGQSGRFRIVFVGSLETPYKAPDVLIRAFAKCIQAGLDAELSIIGKGREKPVFEALAQRLGVFERTRFVGSVPAGEGIRLQLDAGDLFVLPSRQEGLPRVLVEAMARGLPCIASSVGGIPELLPEQSLVAPGDVGGLAAKILELAANPTLRSQQGAQNLATARRYHRDVLQPKRTEFYRCLRDITEAWQRANQNRPSAQSAYDAIGHMPNEA